MKIKKLFIANRGEICRRIALTAKRLGIATATIVEEQTPNYLAELIDEPISDFNSDNIFLDVSELIRLAKKHQCDGIHPGFGFLSERADFARGCIDAGIIWVGPNPESMDAMASKEKARQLAIKAQVPVTPGVDGFEPKSESDPLNEIKSSAAKIGYPVIVKAAYGGGGKGMRIARSEADLSEAINRCHSEAKSSFGNGLLLMEKFIQSPRHIEVQVLGDKHGNLTIVGDRDCSVQRRHQKIIEEAPAPFLNPKTREKMHAAATHLSKEVSYDSTGTVEFLVDGSTPHNQEQDFYFLEMNTRLQVEHPVSEQVFGLDLVEWQLHVATGAKALLQLGEPRGHSIEVRLYAEDPAQNFMPSPGKVYYFEPYQTAGIRWELGLDQIDEIATNYDPMVAKCIAISTDRKAASLLLAEALKQTIICGPENNKLYLQTILQSENFYSRMTTTHFIDEFGGEISSAIETSSSDNQQTANNLLAKMKAPQMGATEPSFELRSATQRIFGGSSTIEVELPVQFKTTLESTRFPDLRVATTKLGKSGEFLAVSAQDTRDQRFWVCFAGLTYGATISQSNLSNFLSGQKSAGDIVAPVPGKVVEVRIKPKQLAEKGETVIVLESMKMEFELKADKSGTIDEITTRAGDQVKAGDLLASWVEE